MAIANNGSIESLKAAAGSQLSFGGRGGSGLPTGDTGGKQLIVYSGNVIDSITIGERKFGGGGGGQKIVARIPENGAILFTKLGSRPNVISYMQLIIDNVIHEAGDRDGSDCMLEMPPTPLRFNTIFSGSVIDKIVFDIAAST